MKWSILKMQNNNYNRKKIRGSSPHYEIGHNPSYWETPPSDRTGSRNYSTENIIQNIKYISNCRELHTTLGEIFLKASGRF